MRLQSRVEVAEPLVELRRLVAAERVVVVTETDREPVEPEPAERALGRVGRPERRLREPLVEVLHDHGRLR